MVVLGTNCLLYSICSSAQNIAILVYNFPVPKPRQMGGFEEPLKEELSSRFLQGQLKAVGSLWLLQKHKIGIRECTKGQESLHLEVRGTSCPKTNFSKI